MDLNLLKSVFGDWDMSQREISIPISVEKIEIHTHNGPVFSFHGLDKETAVEIAKELQSAAITDESETKTQETD